MSALLERHAAPQAERRSPRAGITILVIGGLIVAGLVGWQVAGAAAANSLELRTDGQPLACHDQQVTMYDFGESHDGYRYLPAAELRPGLDCELRFYVTNTGLLPVSVDRATFPLLGAGSKVATVVEFEGLLPDAPTDPIAAAFSYGTAETPEFRLAPGETRELSATLRWADTVCMSEGTSMTLSGGGLLVEASALGVAADRRVPHGVFALLGTPQSDCVS